MFEKYCEDRLPETTTGSAATHTLTGVPRYHHVIPVLQELYWLPLAYQAQFQGLVIITYKALWFGTWEFEGLSYSTCFLLYF